MALIACQALLTCDMDVLGFVLRWEVECRGRVFILHKSKSGETNTRKNEAIPVGTPTTHGMAKGWDGEFFPQHICTSFSWSKGKEAKRGGRDPQVLQSCFFLSMGVGLVS